MAIKVNSKGKAHAHKLVDASKVDRDSAWSFSGDDGNKLLGPDRDDWVEYSKWFLAENTSENEETKARYEYPFGKNGKVYRAGVIAAKQRAAAQGETDIETIAGGILKKIDKDDDKKSRGRKEIKAKYYIIRGEVNQSAEMLIYQDIGEGFFTSSLSAKQFVDDLRAFGDINNLDIRINSYGGSVFDGMAMYNVLKAHKAQKTVYIDGVAASAATLPAMAGDRIVMPENAQMMIHNPWTFAMGDADDLRKTADQLDLAGQSLVAIYKTKSNLSEDEILDMMNKETWMLAKDCEEYGFCDEVIEDEVSSIAAYAGKSAIFAKFRNTPKTLKGKTIMHKCKHCGAHLEEGDVCNCSTTQNMERSRVKNLLALGKKYNLRDLAEDFVGSGRSEQEFQNMVLERMSDNQSLSIQTISDVGRGGRTAAGPYNSFGDQLLDVVAAARNPGRAPNRLHQVMNATGMSEAVPSDGGFLVQQDFTNELLDRFWKVSQVASKCRQIPIGGNSNGLKAPIIDETSRATGSRWGGVQIYRVNEAGSATKAKPKFGLIDLRLEKLMGICYVTDEQLMDGTSLQSVVQQAFSEEFGFVLDNEILWGSGAGQCLGILNSAARSTVAKESAQTAQTIVLNNITKMMSHMWARGMSNCEWFINQEILPQLYGMTLGNYPIFLPPMTGVSASPSAMLLGRPLNVIEQAAGLGTEGDIMLLDLSQYVVIDKGLRSEASIHVQFLTDEMTFRFTYRVNGQPMWRQAITPYETATSLTISPFVTLATRS